jgi:APA family basic amino acid/polyamine antiporter
MLRLKRDVGLIGILSAGVGTILGAGIYALLGEAAILSGNLLWFSFLLASIIAALTGLSYAELSSKFPSAGAEFTYVGKIFNRRMANLVGYGLLFTGVFSCATLSLAFGGYITSMLSVNSLLFALIVLLAVAVITYSGIKFSIGFNIMATIVELAGLIIIIWLGAGYFGSVDYFSTGSYGSVGVFTALGVIFFAYLGFEDMVKLAEETKKVRKIMPLALILSIAITTVVYILVAVSAVSIVSVEELGHSESPITLIFQTATGSELGYLFSIIALFSIFNTLLLLFIAATRVAYSMGRSFSLPEAFSKLDIRTRTPYLSIAVLAVLIAVVVFFGTMKITAQITDIFILSVFVVINASVIKLRYSDIKKKGFRVPLSIGRFPVLPLLGAIGAFAVLLITFLNVINIM